MAIVQCALCFCFCQTFLTGGLRQFNNCCCLEFGCCFFSGMCANRQFNRFRFSFLSSQQSGPTCFGTSASAVWRVVSTSCWACTAFPASAFTLPGLSACDCSSDFAATAMALAWLAISVCCCYCSISSMASRQVFPFGFSETGGLRCTICCRCDFGFLYLVSFSQNFSAELVASRRSSASIAAILALCSCRIPAFLTRCVAATESCKAPAVQSPGGRRESASRVFSLTWPLQHPAQLACTFVRGTRDSTTTFVSHGSEGSGLQHQRHCQD